MPNQISFTVPGPPQPQQRPRARAFQKDKQGPWIAQVYNAKGPDADYRARVAHEAAIAMHGKKLFCCPLFASVRFVVQRPKSKPKYKQLPDVRPDLDNYEKAVFDAMEGIVYDNDSRICSKHSEKLYMEFGGQTYISILEMEEPR